MSSTKTTINKDKNKQNESNRLNKELSLKFHKG